MKRLLLLITAIVLLLSFSGCKQSPAEEGVVDSVVAGTTNEKTEQPEEQQSTEKQEETKEPITSTEKTEESDKKTEKEETPNTSSPTEQPETENEPSSTETEAEENNQKPGRLIFDYEDMQLTVGGGVASGYTPFSVPLEDLSYSEWMNLIGKNYVLVAGYATGMRESFWNMPGEYTLTDFVVTNVYYGAISQKSIKVRENYAVIQEGDRRYYSESDLVSVRLKNDMRVLVFLKPMEDGNYKVEYYPIPLMEDYQSYSEEKLKSILDFYRGDRSQYHEVNEKGEWVETYPHKDREDTMVRYSIRYWPKRELSDKALLEEMKENILLRLATEYEIVIWPYGHKNFKVDPYMPSEFVSLCLPKS